jgi:hypothetical protein
VLVYIYIICIYNVLILSDYCVTMKNDLPAAFASLRSKIPECFVLSLIIGRAPMNSVELH